MPHKIQMRSVEALIPYARNSRTHSDEQVAQIAASIKEFGWTSPILIDGKNGVLAGHGQLLAAKKLGMDKVQVIELPDFTEEQRKAYIIADNKIGLNSGWDVQMLALEIADLKDAGYGIEFTGFERGELEALLGSAVDLEVTGSKEYGADDFRNFNCTCPKCGFEFNK